MLSLSRRLPSSPPCLRTGGRIHGTTPCWRSVSRNTPIYFAQRDRRCWGHCAADGFATTTTTTKIPPLYSRWKWMQRRALPPSPPRVTRGCCRGWWQIQRWLSCLQQPQVPDRPISMSLACLLACFFDLLDCMINHSLSSLSPSISVTPPVRYFITPLTHSLHTSYHITSNRSRIGSERSIMATRSHRIQFLVV